MFCFAKGLTVIPGDIAPWWRLKLRKLMASAAAELHPGQTSMSASALSV